jgi:hypothetical protein
MDAFQLIQNFFSRMHCNYCSHSFAPDDIELIRQEESMFIVNVHCGHCNKQNGIAMVGLESGEDRQAAGLKFADPELTEDEIYRLSDFDPISEDDVLDAHQFIQGLDENWVYLIPSAMRQPETTIQTEFAVE